MKHLAGLGVVSLLSMASLAAACGGSDQSDVLANRTNQPTTDGDAGDVDAASSSSSSSGASSSSSSSSGSTTSSGGTDSGTDAATATNAFTGAGAYTATTGRNTNKPGDHPNAGNPAKAACLSCHGPGGDGPRFFAGGTVYKDVAATMPAAQVEVRFRDASGKALSTYTDALGNFVVTANAASTAGIAFPLQVGVRNGTATKLMSATIANGDCNSSTCHGGTQGFVHVP